MICFKKIYFPHADKAEIEEALLKYSINRDKPLDRQSAFLFDDDKNFLHRFEGKHDVQFARLRTRVYRRLPEVIAIFPKNEQSSFYKLRLGALSTAVCCLLLAWTLIKIVLFKTDSTDIYKLILAGLSLFVFLLLTMLEIIHTKLKIARAISRYRLVNKISKCKASF